MGDDDRRDKSWREIDRQKDKSSHVDRESRSRGGRDKRSSSKYKSDLEKLFQSSDKVPERFQEVMKDLEPEEGTPEAERKEAIAKLRDTEGFRAFAQAVNEFRKEGWALPDDEELLIRMLDHPDVRVVRDVLEHVADLIKRRSWNRTAPLKNRLSTIKTMSDDPRTLKAVDSVETQL